jgi:hypothetical protein
MSVKVYDISLFLKMGINPNDFVDIDCSCGFFLGYANKNDLKPSKEIMFQCPKCLERFDVIKN